MSAMRSLYPLTSPAVRTRLPHRRPRSWMPTAVWACPRSLQAEQGPRPPGQVRLHPGFGVTEPPARATAASAWCGASSDHHRPAAASQSTALREHGLDVGQPRGAVAGRAGHQRLARLGPHLGGQLRPTRPRSRTAGSTRPGRRRRAAASGSGSSQLPSDELDRGAERRRGRPDARPGSTPPPSSASALASVAHTSATTPGPSSVASDSAMAPDRCRRRPPRGPRRRTRRRAVAAPRPAPPPPPARSRAAGSAPAGRPSRSSERNGQWPKMYCSGSPAARRAAMRAPPRRRRRRAARRRIGCPRSGRARAPRRR